MEGLAALGVVSNIMQVIRYGIEAVELIGHIHKMEGSSRMTELDIHAAHVASAVDTLQASLETVGTRARDRDASDLYELSQRCLMQANELQHSIASIPRGRRKRDVFGVAMWIIRKRSSVDKIKQQLDIYQHDLDTRILVRLSSKIDAQSLEAPDFVEFKQEFSQLVRGLTTRHKKSLEAAIHLEGHATREAIASSNNTVSLIESRLSELTSQSSLSRHYYRRERLLSSLEYPSMNARRNQISPPHADTFDWPFREGKIAREGDLEDRKARWDSLGTWMETGNGAYWINGKAGSGKSTLMKHLVNSPSTLATLEKWATPSPVVLVSHYFWTAGSLHERSSKGFLLSTLHQLLLNAPDILQDLLSSNEDLTLKKALDDWSEAELTRTIEEVISMAQVKVCFFIDGLDEFEQPPLELTNALLNFINWVNDKAHGKCCVSSRPVLRYEAAFANCPQMKLQDLTEYDIRRVIDVAFEAMSAHNATGIPIQSSALREMREEIIQKADGVFIWVALVLKSLTKGFGNGDDLQILQRRLNSLPSEIEKLYEHMWRQLNDDQELYREEAAFIFTLVLHREDFWMVNTEEHNSYCRSLCFFTMVINGVDIKTALPKFRDAAVERIEAQCVEMVARIRTRCAGILEVVGPEDTNQPSLANGNLFHDRLGRFITQEVRFIHRSAYAFLVETSFGNSLLRFCPHSQIDIATRIVQCALLFWHTKVTNQGELPYTLHLAERFMVQHARSKEERQGLSAAISATLEMYKTLSGWSTDGEQDGSYLLYQYIDPAVRYHTVDTAGWMLSFATKQVFAQAYGRSDIRVNPDFTDYLLLCLASQIHFRVPNPRHDEQVEHLEVLLDHSPRLDTIFYLRYPYPFKKSAALLLTENLIYDILNLEHWSEPYKIMQLLFTRATQLGWDLAAKFIVLWTVESMYQSMIMPIESLFVTNGRYSHTAILEVNLCYLLELVTMACGDNKAKAALSKAVSTLLIPAYSAGVVPEMQVLLVSAGGWRPVDGFRTEKQQLADIDARKWKSPASDREARYLKFVYEQYQLSRPEMKAWAGGGTFGQFSEDIEASLTGEEDQGGNKRGGDVKNLPDAVEKCAQMGVLRSLFEYLETKGYCQKPDGVGVMHKAPKPLLDT